jgi:sulfite exporter TauE/SafE/copper chaperone CopZ
LRFCKSFFNSQGSYYLAASDIFIYTVIIAMKIKKATLYIEGMHCPSCDILVKDKFCELKNIEEVKADHRHQKAEISYTGELNHEMLNKTIQPFGYSILENKEEEFKEPLIKRLTDASAIALIAFIVFYFIQDAHIFPTLNVGSGIALITFFVIGLVASTSTCMATSGALFLTTIGKLRKESISFKENIIPAISFNVGRIVSYGIFGLLVGFIGKTLTVNLQLGSILTLFVSVVMILIGLENIKLISFSWVSSTSFSKGIFEKLQAKFTTKPKQTAFLLGAITYLLPCGFTQSVQIYALGLADPIKSSVIMMIFALGTVPALLAIGFASSFTKNTFYPLFQKSMGVIIIMIGVGYIFNFATLHGVFSYLENTNQNLPYTTQNIEEQNGIQVMNMSVDSAGYSPSSFVVKQGEPVKWVINGKSIIGCQSVLVAPKLGIEKSLALGINVVEFTPSEKGAIPFSCNMGMYKGLITVI